MTMQENPDAERRGEPVKLGQELADSLAKLGEMRKKMPDVIPAPSLPAVRLVSSGQIASEPTITRRDMASVLAPLETVYLGRQLSEMEVATKYEVYFHVLKPLTHRQLSRAAERYLKSTDPVFEFFPKPAHLLDLAKDRF